MSNKPPNAPEDEISWRTVELGPEMRRRLFEKVLPSASPGVRREGPAPTTKNDKDDRRDERSKRPKHSRK